MKKGEDKVDIAWWRPGNWLAACGLGLLRLGALFPLRWMQRVGRWLGLLAWTAFPFRRRVALANLEICFPEKSGKERRQLAREHYAAMGAGIFELGAAWYAKAEQLDPLLEVEGLEHVQSLRESGQGALLITAHFTCMELVGRYLVERIPLSCIYRRPNQPVLARAMDERRLTKMERIIQFTHARGFVQALRDGCCVWYTPDQGKRIKESSLLPFFGEPAITNTAVARIARSGRAQVIPFFGYRRADGGYRIRMLPPQPQLLDADSEAVGRHMNAIFASFVREAPEQYFWLHKRFKARGEGYADPYARS